MLLYRRSPPAEEVPARYSRYAGCGVGRLHERRPAPAQPAETDATAPGYESETPGRGTLVLAGCTPALSLWARAAERWQPSLRVHWTFANSEQALHALARG